MNMLRSIREKKGMTVGQLAARSSIPSRVLADYEEGRQSIPLPHAKLLAKALWVSIEDLMPPGGTALRPTASQQPEQPSRPQSDSVPPPRPAPPAPSAPSEAPQVRSEGPLSPQLQQTPLPPRPAADGQKPISGSRPAPQHSSSQGPRRGGDMHGPRPPRAVAPAPTPVSDGQTEEILRLALRLNMDNAGLETHFGKPMAGITRMEAKDWIKQLRMLVNENEPGGKVRFGQWPEAREDQEALYLQQQQEAGVPFHFKLFNGDEFKGAISDFTPYTITIKTEGKTENDGSDVVLRKLAIAYYRMLPDKGSAEATASPPEKPARKKSAAKPKEAVQEQHQPLDSGVESDRVGEPSAPEIDNMDEDRGV